MEKVELNDCLCKIKNQKIALFGLGRLGWLCYEYFKRIQLIDQLEVFIDMNKQNIGTTFKGFPVEDISWLLKNPDVILLITKDNFIKFYDILKAEKIKNKIFCFLDFIPPYEDDEFLDNKEFILSFYKSKDKETENIVDILVKVRTREDKYRIQRFESVKNISAVQNYWYKKDIDLNLYEDVTIVDCGAYTGDTLEELYEKYPYKIKEYIAIEPGDKNYKKLIKTININGYNKFVSPMQIGLGERNETVYFKSFKTGSHIVEKEKSNSSIIVKKLDDLDINVCGKLCIKMDIEGKELEALRGAKKIIQKYKPNLAICVYHKNNDVYKIPRYIKSLIPEYTCVLRGGNHMVCYASIDYK